MEILNQLIFKYICIYLRKKIHPITVINSSLNKIGKYLRIYVYIYNLLILKIIIEHQYALK